MPTVSTIPTVKQRLVTLLDAELTVPVFYAWPGGEAPPECVFLGRYPDLDEDRVEGSSRIATIKAGRKHRTETYTIPVTVWSFRPDLTSTEAAAAEARAFELLADLEDVLADDPTLGIDIQWARLGDYQSTGHPFEKGRVYELIADVDVQARLT